MFYTNRFTGSDPDMTSYLLSFFLLQPLLPIEHNGPGLEYKVSYKRQDEEDWQEHMVKRHSYVVMDTPTFIPFEIKIQAKNHQGWGPEPKVVTGYSGEDCEWLNRVLLRLGGHLCHQL